MRREQASFPRGGDQVCIKAKHDISLGPWPFQLQTREQGSTVTRADELQITSASLLERGRDGGAGAPFADETVVCHHLQHGGLRRCAAGTKRKSRNKWQINGFLHSILQMRRADWGIAELPYLPSAGPNRFRFNGSARASQPVKAPRGGAKARVERGRAQGKPLEPVPPAR